MVVGRMSEVIIRDGIIIQDKTIGMNIPDVRLYHGSGNGGNIFFAVVRYGSAFTWTLISKLNNKVVYKPAK